MLITIAYHTLGGPILIIFIKNQINGNRNTQSPVSYTHLADGTDEYYITTAPQKTLAGKIIIWTLVALMALGSIGSLIVALIQILSK